MKLKRILLIVLVFQFAHQGNCQAIKINKISVFNQNSDSTFSITISPIKLNFKQTHILINFVDSLDQKAKYTIKLEGFDQKWMQINDSKYANYINLPGGNYDFKVKNLNYPDKIVNLKFSIEEAFWQKIWFIPSLAGYLLFILGLIYYLFQTAKQKQDLRLQKVRNEIAADMHDDVGATLSNINLLTDIAKNQEDKNKTDEILVKISTNAKEMIHTMRGMVWSVNAENDNALDFLEKVKKYIEAMALQKNIEVSYQYNTLKNTDLSIELQRNYFLIIKEIVNNCNKYSMADTIIYKVLIQNNWLMSQFDDNGIGFELKNENINNGIKNIKTRIEELGGNLEIKTGIKKGVKYRISIPLNLK